MGKEKKDRRMKSLKWVGYPVNPLHPGHPGPKDVIFYMRKSMLKKNLLSRITLNPDILVGKPTIRGLRISVEQILKALSNNISVVDLLEDYPELEEKDIQAVLLYAAELVNHEKVYNLKDQSLGL